MLGRDGIGVFDLDKFAALDALFCRRRHQPRRPPLAKIRLGSPAPSAGAVSRGILSRKSQFLA
jgi:hypothetical protein